MRAPGTCFALVIWLAATCVGSAAEPTTDLSNGLGSPPSRPLALTAVQINDLEDLARQPQYGVAPDTPASYSPKAARTLTELSAPGFYVGYFGTLIWVLVAAAPL